MGQFEFRLFGLRSRKFKLTDHESSCPIFSEMGGKTPAGEGPSATSAGYFFQ